MLCLCKLKPGLAKSTRDILRDYVPSAGSSFRNREVSIEFLLTVKAATLKFISGRGSAISLARQEKAGSYY